MTEKQAPAGLAIDPDAINQYVAQQILESGIGEAVRKVTDAEIAKLSRSYDNPWEPVIRNEILKIVTQIVLNEYQDTLRERVKASLTQDAVDEIIDDLIKVWVNKRGEFSSRY